MSCRKVIGTEIGTEVQMGSMTEVQMGSMAEVRM